MRRRVLVVPDLQRREDVAPLLHRLGFYLAHVRPESVTLVVHPEADEECRSMLADPMPLPDFDPVSAERLRAVAERFRLVPGRDRDALVDGADVVVVADTSRTQEWDTALARRTPHLAVVEADVHRTRQEGAKLAEVAYRLSPSQDLDLRRSRQRLMELVSDLGDARTAYLVATGPSVRAAMSHDLSDGVRIVCNTVVLDDELMRHVKPNVVTFADPIFHFGPSAYAGKFRAALSAAAAAHDFHIVVVERYRRLLASLLPALEPRIIGIPLGNGDGLTNLNLQAAAIVKPRPNILTMLMFPLAATMADDIRLIGFDGREPGESYFWKHGRSVQLHDELAGIRRVHPAFFDLSYEDYYAEHVQAVEAYARAAEVVGKRVYSLTPSHMPPLCRRALTDDLLPVQPRMPEVDGRHVVVSVEPDWISDFGHYRLLNTLLHRSACDHGRAFVALTSRGLPVDVPWQRPTFTHPTSKRAAAPVYSETFREELSRALDELTDRATSVTALFYTADLWHLPPLLAVAAQVRGDVRFVVNLMRSHADIVEAAAAAPGERSWAGGLLREAHELAGSLGVTLTVDTEELNDHVEALLGTRLTVWPMIALQQPRPSTVTAAAGAGPVRVYSPARPYVGRGYCDFAALARAVSQAPDSAGFEFVARYERQPEPSPPAIHAALADLERAGATVLWGATEDEQYLADLARADVVVVPYHLDEFRTRTSAVLIDAVLAGKPVVMTAGTWMARVVEQYGVGETYADRDVDDLERAVRLVAQKLDKLTRRLAEVRDEVAAEFAPERLWQLIETMPAHVRTPDDARDRRVERFEASAAGTLALALAHERTLADSRSARLAREHAFSRDREARALRVDELSRAVRYHLRRLAAAERRARELEAERTRLEKRRARLRRKVKQLRRRSGNGPAARSRRVWARTVRRLRPDRSRA